MNFTAEGRWRRHRITWGLFTLGFFGLGMLLIAFCDGRPEIVSQELGWGTVLEVGQPNERGVRRMLVRMPNGDQVRLPFEHVPPVVGTEVPVWTVLLKDGDLSYHLDASERRREGY